MKSAIKFNNYIERCRYVMAKYGELPKKPYSFIIQDLGLQSTKTINPWKTAVGTLIQIKEWKRRQDGKLVAVKNDHSIFQRTLAENIPGFQEKLVKCKNAQDMYAEMLNEVLRKPETFAKEWKSGLKLMINIIIKLNGYDIVKKEINNIIEPYTSTHYKKVSNTHT